MQISVKDIAELVNGTVVGNPNSIIHGPSKIEEGGEGTITFLANPKYEAHLYTTTASAVLVHVDFEPAQPIDATLIKVQDVYATVAMLLEQFGGAMAQNDGIASNAVIAESAKIDASASVGHFAIVSENVTIAADTKVFAQVFLGANVSVGKNVTIYPGVKIYQDCVIGDNCVLHSNCVIGSDGFGFAPQEDGTFKKVQQIGNVVLEANVEVGANTVIDRATMGSTVIKKGAKLDNLIQIAHNVVVGENTVIAAQAGIAGSTKLGKNVMVGGQVGMVGHIEVADKVRIQAQSGIAAAIKEEGKAVYGSPAIPYSDYLRAYAVFKKFPALEKRIRQLEKQLKTES